MNTKVMNPSTADRQLNKITIQLPIHLFMTKLSATCFSSRAVSFNIVMPGLKHYTFWEIQRMAIYRCARLARRF